MWDGRSSLRLRRGRSVVDEIVVQLDFDVDEVYATS